MIMRKTFTVPGSTPISRRVNEVGNSIRAWIRSLDPADRPSLHSLRSKGFERRKGQYHYHYEILDAAPREQDPVLDRPSLKL